MFWTALTMSITSHTEFYLPIMGTNKIPQIALQVLKLSKLCYNYNLSSKSLANNFQFTSWWFCEMRISCEEKKSTLLRVFTA
jgi:hypothetical protein